MNAFLLNLVLAIVWALLAGSIDLANLVVGFVLGFILLWLVKPMLGGTGYFRRIPEAVRFVAFFVKELVIANVMVARDVLAVRPKRRPGVVAVPLDAKTDTEITLLSIVVLLTPGTLVIDVSEDRRVMYIHAMFLESPEALCAEIKEGFERRVLELLR
ncbi:MAG: Na+/H+ antiporter subunit E [Acidobacteriota bacterium]|nr:Na+/H+ antiporter subunit E [Acidobacteriota bacterium]